MKFSDIAGNESVKQRLRDMVASDRIPHALLLEGPEGIGNGKSFCPIHSLSEQDA